MDPGLVLLTNSDGLSPYQPDFEGGYVLLTAREIRSDSASLVEGYEAYIKDSSSGDIHSLSFEFSESSSLQHGHASLKSDTILSTSDIPLLEQITGVDFDGDGLTGSYGTVAEVAFNPTHNFRTTTIDDRYVYLNDSNQLVLSTNSVDAGWSLSNDSIILRKSSLSAFIMPMVLLILGIRRIRRHKDS